MAQYDVHRASFNGQLLLDCQSDLLNDFGTRFVIPLVEPDVAIGLSRLHPLPTVADQTVMAATHLASAVGTDELGPIVASLGEQRYAVINALDMLISGY